MVLKRKYVKNYFASSKTDNDKSLISTNATKRFIRAYIFNVVSNISLFNKGNFFGKISAVLYIKRIIKAIMSNCKKYPPDVIYIFIGHKRK